MRVSTSSLKNIETRDNSILVFVKINGHEVGVMLYEQEDGGFTIALANPREHKQFGIFLSVDGVLRFAAGDKTTPTFLQRNVDSGILEYRAEKPLPKINGREYVEVHTGLGKIMGWDDEEIIT